MRIDLETAKEAVARFITTFSRFIDAFKGTVEARGELASALEKFRFPTLKLSDANMGVRSLERTYVLYSGEHGKIYIMIAGGMIRLEVSVKWEYQDKIVFEDTGLPKDYRWSSLAEVLFFLKHAGEAREALEAVIQQISEEESLVRKLVEDIKELMAIIEMWKISREGER